MAARASGRSRSRRRGPRLLGRPRRCVAASPCSRASAARWAATAGQERGVDRARRFEAQIARRAPSCREEALERRNGGRVERTRGACDQSGRASRRAARPAAGSIAGAVSHGREADPRVERVGRVGLEDLGGEHARGAPSASRLRGLGEHVEERAPDAESACARGDDERAHLADEGRRAPRSSPFEPALDLTGGSAPRARRRDARDCRGRAGRRERARPRRAGWRDVRRRPRRASPGSRPSLGGRPRARARARRSPALARAPSHAQPVAMRRWQAFDAARAPHRGRRLGVDPCVRAIAGRSLPATPTSTRSRTSPWAGAVVPA